MEKQDMDVRGQGGGVIFVINQLKGGIKMETRQGKIEEKTLKKAGNQAPYCTFKIDGKLYNTFDKAIIDAYNPDDFVVFEGEINQKGFWELKTMAKTEEGAVSAPMETPGYPKMIEAKNVNPTKEYHLSPEEVKCRALESSIAFGGNEIPIDLMLEAADRFVEWIYGN